MSTEFRPFVARAHLATHISLEQPIHLEGILYDVRFRRDPDTMGQPLDCIAYEDGVPKVSAGVLVADGPGGAQVGSVTQVRRIDTRGRELDRMHLDRSMPSAQRSIGQMSPYRPRLRDYALLSGINEVMWQGVGDPAKIARMLEQVPGVGTLRMRGYGQVRRWQVHACGASPHEAGWFADGRLLRRMPTATIVKTLGALPEGLSVRTERAQPPFWVSGEEVEVAQPTLRQMTMTREDAVRLLRLEHAFA